MEEPEVLKILESLLKTAATGENYSDTQYHKERYSTIRNAVEQLYDKIYSIDKKALEDIDPIGYITPKVGVNALIRNEKGELLLEQREDDHAWGLPGGWAEVGLSAEENVIKEVKEETGLSVRVIKIITIFSRKPTVHSLHTSYHILFECAIVDGVLTTSHESLTVQWKRVDDITAWHFDHKEWIDALCLGN